MKINKCGSWVIGRIMAFEVSPYRGIMDLAEATGTLPCVVASLPRSHPIQYFPILGNLGNHYP